MNTRPLLACILLFSMALFSTAGIIRAEETPAVDYLRDVTPILTQNCIACHNAKKAEGGLSLESHKALLAGGDSGAAVIAAKLDEGTLIERVTSEDDPMPPEGNSVGAKRLTSEQIDLLRRWIAAGAVAPAEGVGKSLQWQPVPEGLQPVYALATSPDGNHLAFGRGGLVTVTRQIHGPDETVPMQPLIDPAIEKSLGSDSTGNLVTHLDIVQSLAFSPDSGRLATGGYRTVKIWRRKTLPTHTLAGLSKPVGPSAISLDGRWIAQSFGDHVLEITDRPSGRARRYLTTHSAEVTALAWLADPPRLISADRAGQVALTDAEPEQVESVSFPSGLVCQTLKRVDDARLLVIDEHQRLHLATMSVDEATGKKTFATSEIAGFETVAAIAVAQPTANQAVIALADGKLKLVSLPEFEVVREIATPTGIQSVEISPDGGLVATLPTSGPAQLWNASSGELLASLDQDLSRARLLATGGGNVARQKSWIETLAAKIPELQKAAEQEVEATKKVQELRDKAAEALTAKVNEVAMATTGVTEAEQAVTAAEAAVAEAMKQVEAKKAELEAKRTALAEIEKQKMAADAELAKRDQALATATDSSERAAAKIPAWEQRIAGEKSQLTALETEYAAIQAETPATDQPTSLVFTPDGKQLAVTHRDRYLRLFATETGKPVSGLPIPAEGLTLVTTDKQDLVCLSDGGVVQSWDLQFPWELERTIGGIEESPFSDRITALDFSPDGKLLAVGSGPPSRYGDIKLIDTETGEIALDLGEAHSDTVLSLHFAPDGRILASAGADKLCRVFDVATGTLHRALEGHTHHVLGVAWKDDAQTLVTASADTTLKVWDVESATQKRTIAGFGKEVAAVRFVGNTSELVVASTDGTARLYNADNGQQVRVFGGASNALYAVTLSAENSQVYSGGQSGQVWVWQLVDGKLLSTIP